MLARPENKSKVEKLTAEIDAFGRNKVPTFEDLDKFPYLEVRHTSHKSRKREHTGDKSAISHAATCSLQL